MAQVTVLADRDARVRSAAPNNNYAGTELVLRSITGNLERIFIHFTIPAYVAIVTAAQFRIWLYSLSGGGSILFNRVIGEDWVENVITWNNQPESSVTGVSANLWNDDAWNTADVTSIVQDWVNGVYPNYGILLRFETEESGSNFRAFRAREIGGSEPRLVIDYIPKGSLQVGGAGQDINWEAFGPAAGSSFSLDWTEIEGSGVSQVVELAGVPGAYAGHGVFTSGVLDHGADFFLKSFDWASNEPAGTTIDTTLGGAKTISVRASDTPPLHAIDGTSWAWGDIPDDSDPVWGGLAWEETVSDAAADVSVAAQKRYTQFRATLWSTP